MPRGGLEGDQARSNQVVMSYVLRSPLVILSMLVLAVLACEPGDDDDEGDGLTEPDERCASGVRWAGGERESARMFPGRDCVGCHDERGEAEEINLAGTVFGDVSEPDDCFGVEGVEIVLTGADGRVVTLESNEAGNFSREHLSIAVPYTAKLVYEGRERPMVTPQTKLSCNSCHAQVGLENAPGRIVAP